MEKVTIVVVTRDRFSTTEECLETLIAHTNELHELIVVMGGVPPDLQKTWKEHFGSKVRFLFQPELMNPPQLRNIGLKSVSTRLAILMDNDVFVRPHWLESLVECQAETGAAMVVPIVLEQEHMIHTAGNELVITYQNGKPFGQKELCYAKQMLYDGCNLKRKTTDYGELHCQLVVAETASRLGVYDEMYREVAEVDSGLTWAKAGCSMWFEPRSVVRFDYPHDRIRRVEDIRPYQYKWDMNAILKGYQYFEKKWNLDITECGKWGLYNLHLNNKLGLLSRLWPSRVALVLDGLYPDTLRCLSQIIRPWSKFKAWIFGFYKW